MANTTKRNTKSRATQKTAHGFHGYRAQNGKRIENANQKGGPRKPPPSNSGSLRVMRLNVQRCLTLRHTELRTVLIKRGDHIVLAQETLLWKNREYSLSGYACYRYQYHLCFVRTLRLFQRISPSPPQGKYSMTSAPITCRPSLPSTFVHWRNVWTSTDGISAKQTGMCTATHSTIL
ncbi:hypothetical protein PoB_007505500 [Plakobranchus ocellatus]|uniref:Uncharacterized protein n=1 Tax=Plakobranchus ocellatus TaxID=259542 RepID=A0AAV4DWL3_9GAST|nr:hypothetical protein PoB_007505500 [Plakobranchus ocellatus]